MSLFGIGIDLIRIERFDAAIARHGDRFAQRILMPQELAGYADRRFKARYLAMRFAGKEAVAKALGTGFAHGIWVRDIGIVHNTRGKPNVIFSERGLGVCAELGVGVCHVSLSDEAGIAMAYAIAERAGEGASPTR
ncbi:MAG: holo-ACP synthase [Pseudomonadota bacterium]